MSLFYPPSSIFNLILSLFPQNTISTCSTPVQMVTSIIDSNPLDPTAMQQQKSSGNESPQKASPTHKLGDLDMIIDRNVAPYADPPRIYTRLLSVSSNPTLLQLARLRPCVLNLLMNMPSRTCTKLQITLMSWILWEVRKWSLRTSFLRQMSSPPKTHTPLIPARAIYMMMKMLILARRPSLLWEVSQPRHPTRAP